MKKQAWTLAELTVVIVVILILAKASISVARTMDINKGRIYMYATMRNLTMGNLAIKEKFGEFYPASASVHDANNSTDWYCTNLADNFSIESTPFCADSTTSTTANFIFSNGISFKGMSSAWQNTSGDLYYKDILVDIDGDLGSNKIGIDRYPLRVFRGTNTLGVNMDGMILPVDCNQADPLVGTSHSYCNGATNNIASSAEIFSYSIYRVTNGKKPESATIIMAGKTALESDCLALGGKGIYPATACKAKNFYIHESCAHEDICADCAFDGTCPNNGTEESCMALAEKNKLADKEGVLKGYKCIPLLTKPTSGLGLFGGAIMAEVGI